MLLTTPRCSTGPSRSRRPRDRRGAAAVEQGPRPARRQACLSRDRPAARRLPGDGGGRARVGEHRLRRADRERERPVRGPEPADGPLRRTTSTGRATPAGTAGRARGDLRRDAEVTQDRTPGAADAAAAARLGGPRPGRCGGGAEAVMPCSTSPAPRLRSTGAAAPLPAPRPAAQAPPARRRSGRDEAGVRARLLSGLLERLDDRVLTASAAQAKSGISIWPWFRGVEPRSACTSTRSPGSALRRR